MSLQDIITLLINDLKNIKEKHLEWKVDSDDSEAMRNLNKLIEMGGDLFEKFCELGCEANKNGIESFCNVTEPELKSIIKELADLIVDTKPWLHHFLTAYPHLFIHFDEGEFVGVDNCECRSGFQFLLDLFRGYDSNLDITLQYLDQEARESFDDILNLAKEYTEFQVTKEDIPEGLPKHHNWWF